MSPTESRSACSSYGFAMKAACWSGRGRSDRLGGRHENERDLPFDERLGHAEALAADHIDVEQARNRNRHRDADRLRTENSAHRRTSCPSASRIACRSKAIIGSSSRIRMRTPNPYSLAQQDQLPEPKSLLESGNFVPAWKQPVHGPRVPEIGSAHRKFENSGLTPCGLRNAADRAPPLETGPPHSYLMINLVA